MNEQCHVVLQTAREAFNSPNMNFTQLAMETKKLQDMMNAMPLQTDVDKVAIEMFRIFVENASFISTCTAKVYCLRFLDSFLLSICAVAW